MIRFPTDAEMRLFLSHTPKPAEPDRVECVECKGTFTDDEVVEFPHGMVCGDCTLIIVGVG